MSEATAEISGNEGTQQETLPPPPTSSSTAPTKEGEGLTLDETCQMFLDCARYADGEEDMNILKELIADQPEMAKVRDESGRTAVHLAAANGHLEVVEFLVANGATPNDQNNEGNTALHYACEQNQVAVVELLLKKGWKPSAKNRYGETPMRTIAEKKYDDIEVLLTKYDEELDNYQAEGANVEIGDEVPEDLPQEEGGREGGQGDEADEKKPSAPPEAQTNSSGAVSGHQIAEPVVGDATLDDVE